VNKPAGVPPIDLAIVTPASPEAAWQAITIPERIATWFTAASPLGPPGSPYRLDFGDGSVVVGEVLDLEPGRRFVHSWAWQGAEPGEVTTVEWSVEPLPGGGSQVRLVHDGWHAAGLDATARDEHETYWAGYLDNLRDILGEA
jgi:uncharacterized protein YndB with AHSA1/START domain